MFEFSRICAIGDCCDGIGFLFPTVRALLVYYLFFVGCVVICFLLVLLICGLLWLCSGLCWFVSVGSLFLARVILFGSFVFEVRVFTFFIFGGGFCLPFILYSGRGMVWWGLLLVDILLFCRVVNFRWVF